MMSCRIFRSDKKPETYLYLVDQLEFSDLPDALQQQFGEPVFVMQLELTTGRKLARVALEDLLQHLEKSGFYLQLPPELPVEVEISRRFS